jgi:2,3-bisphosphoglycerate-dependent phosphoglycerate mutase
MENKIGKLVLVRHGESEWNILGKWTGLIDIHLSKKGYKESEKTGELIKDIHFDHIFTSVLVRAKETLSGMSKVYEALKVVPTDEEKELNERDYGDYTGKNKWEMKKILGDEMFLKIRRSWSYVLPNGESLEMVYKRIMPFFFEKLLPILKENKNVLIVAHGNSIRSLVKYIEKISDEDISHLEIPFGGALIFNLDKDGHSLGKEIREVK